MDTRQKLSLLVLLMIHLVSESRGKNLTSNATLILFEDDPTLPFQKEKDLLSILRKEKVIPSLENLILIQTSSDVIESPTVINDELLSLLDQTTRVSEISERKKSTVVDQVTAESRSELNSAQQLDLDGIDNLQDVIAITEYEPQKIHPEKAKGKGFQDSGYTDYETTTQPFDKNYYEVPRQKGTTRVPKYGTTKVSPNIRQTEKSRYTASETYRTSPSTFDPSSQKTKLRPLTTSPASTTPYLLPATTVYTPFTEQTRKYNTFTTPNYPRVVNEMKILDNRTKLSKFVTTTIYPSTQTRRIFYSPRSLNFGNFDEGTEGTIGTTVTDSYVVPSKKSKRKKATKAVEALNVKNLELSLQDKARQSRALNHTDNYKFGLLAKYDLMPRPFARRKEDPLHVAAAQAQSKNFLEPQNFPTKPANLWNFKTVRPTLSTNSRSIPTAQVIDSLTKNPYSKLGAYNAPISTFSPYTTLIPPRSSSQNLKDGYVPPGITSRRTTAPRMSSRGRARFNINKNADVEIENKGLSKPEYPARISGKLVESTKFGDYKTHEKDDEARGRGKDGLDKKKGQEQDHHRSKEQISENHQHKQKIGKNHGHKNYHYVDNRDNGVDAYPQDEQDDGSKEERRSKHDHDHKHHASNQKYTRIHDQEHKHVKDDKDIVRDNHHLNHRRNNHNYDDNDKHHYNKHSLNHAGSRDQHDQDEDNKYNDDHDKYDDTVDNKYDDIELHKNEDEEEADHHHYNDPQYRGRDHHHEIHKEKDQEQEEDQDHHVYEYEQDKDSNDDHQDTYDETHVLEDKHDVKDDKRHQDHNHDINHKKKLQDGDRDSEENKGEFTHKHEHKHDHKKGGGDHKHEVGGGAEHEEEHHSEEGEKGDKGYEAWHDNEKAEKGYHDKEDHKHFYDEKEGDKKKHHDEGGYHKEHHFGEKGEKAAEFGEKGEHQSGHNTKGQHFIHKKDEYEKKTEFFDEFHDDGDIEKEGEFHHEYKGGKGGHHKSDKHDAGYHEEKHGKEHHHMKGHHHKEDKGHKEEEGHEEHHDHEHKYGKKDGHEEGKKWAHKKGK